MTDFHKLTTGELAKKLICLSDGQEPRHLNSLFSYMDHSGFKPLVVGLRAPINNLLRWK